MIFGGGNVSVFLTEHLLASSSQFHIKIIEANADRAEAIAERLPKAVVLQGDALDTELQNEANVQSAETVIAVTNDDEVNILSSLLAKQAGCSRAITLTNNQNFGHLMKSMGIDAYVDPRETTVSSILQHIRRGCIRWLQNLAGGMAPHHLTLLHGGGMVFRLFRADSAKLPKQPRLGRRPDYWSQTCPRPARVIA